MHRETKKKKKNRQRKRCIVVSKEGIGWFDTEMKDRGHVRLVVSGWTAFTHTYAHSRTYTDTDVPLTAMSKLASGRLCHLCRGVSSERVRVCDG